MNDLGDLQNRVGSAVEKLQHSQQQRREHNQSLSKILNDLESKFDARTVELEHCRERIAQLEESNARLTELVGQMIEIIEHTASDVADDPVFRASNAAAGIVERHVAEPVAARPAPQPIPEPVANVVPEPQPEPAPEPEPAEEDDILELTDPVSDEADEAPAMSVEDAFAGSDGFEDVGVATLSAENAIMKAEGASEFPKLVYDAIAQARGESAEPESAPAATVETSAVEAEIDDSAFSMEAEEPIEIPEPDHAAEAPVSMADEDGDLDIKEIMARLEIAAERAQLRAEADVRRSSIEPASLGKAVGGNA